MHSRIQFLMVATAVALVVWFCGRVAFSDPRDDVLADAISRWAPGTDPDRAMRLAEIIGAAARRRELPTWVVAAVAMKESGYRQDVEGLRLLGQLGERGLMQVHPSVVGSAARMVPGCRPSLRSATCQIEVGTAWLAMVRDRCPGPWERWVAAYGMSRCPSVSEARRQRSVRRVRAYLSDVGVQDPEV